MNNLCVAHRGASGEAPENTMAAIHLAMASPLVQWIEIDVQLTKDGIPVLIHDDTVNRTTNGKGRVADYTLAELKRLDAGRWFGRSFAGETIPTLEQVLEATVGRCRLNVELKTYGGRYPELEKKVVELLYKWNLQHDTVITSFDTASLRKVRGLSHEIMTGLIIDGAPASLIDDLRRLDARFLSIGYRHVNAARMAAFNEACIQVMAWTINDQAIMTRVAGISPKLMICTNYPERWEKAVLSQRNRPSGLFR
ncbi:glycerophosphodiester phosphodiesterase [Paenibacillus abyssi]|uniref:Glycerophosphoryl diester phosphodiesterase n=1 Tax=Paenibacillus abyssi TaxID=1340531 RepID=A0A917FZV6_9BACL|nr:glycerophosphodiester phosphodiesterase family protein [Paenibacillus abyssi]GGG15663.1 glycerophosphoryl diester phosphodiesterase [Paenibacillus abyssi]